MAGILLDGFSVDLVVLGMGADEPDEHRGRRVSHGHHQAVVVALDIEHHPVVRQKAGIPMHGLDV